MSEPIAYWSEAMREADGDPDLAVQVLCGWLAATADKVEELRRTGYYRATQPASVFPVRDRPPPLDVGDQQNPGG